MKLLRLLKEIDFEFDTQTPDNKIYRRKLAMKKIKDYIANGSKGYLDLGYTPITSLGNLESVGDWLRLIGTPITSLGNLKSVGANLFLQHTPLTSLGYLESVGSNLYLSNSKLLDHYTEEQIRAQVKIGGRIYT